jgi:nucleoside-diphosphate-sugar epimerase
MDASSFEQNGSRTLTKVFVTGGAGFIGGHLVEALRQQAVTIVALARNNQSAAKLQQASAALCRTDLHDVRALAEGMQGCDTVFHVGSYLADWDMETALRENVVGSLNVAAAARAAGVRRLVYVSGTGVTIGSGPVIQADETRPRGRPVGVLCASRVKSEAAILGENGPDLEVVVARFPYVWGPGETLTPALKGAVRAGRFRWINGGRHLISTVHVTNAVEGLLLTARRGQAGEIYWFTDGPPVELRTFFEAHLRKAGLEVPEREISFTKARRLADSMFWLWSVLRSKTPPPLTPTLVRFMGQEITVNDAKARHQLGYAPAVQWPDDVLAPYVSADRVPAAAVRPA